MWVQRSGAAASGWVGYVSRNRAGTRIKLLLVDGTVVWRFVRRLHTGRFHWPRSGDDLPPTQPYHPKLGRVRHPERTDMRKSRFTTEQIIGFIKQAEAGMAVAELGRQHGFSPASFHAWRAKYGGMEAENAKRLKELESENSRLKRLLAEAHLDIEALKVGFGVKR